MRTILAIAAALLLFPSPALAEECVPRTTEPIVACALACVSGDVAGKYYVHNDAAVSGMGSIWIYEESNDVPGLQRSDDWVGDESCGNPDRIIF